jgi:hypothetical protein
MKDKNNLSDAELVLAYQSGNKSALLVWLKSGMFSFVNSLIGM